MQSQTVLDRNEMEIRRMAAAADLAAGARLGDVCRNYGVSRTTVCRWRVRLREGDSLHRRPAPGRPRVIPEEKLAALFYAGPHAAGFRVKRWTGDRFAAAIEKKFGVTFHPDHAGRYLRLFRSGHPL